MDMDVYHSIKAKYLLGILSIMLLVLVIARRAMVMQFLYCIEFSKLNLFQVH